MTDLVLLLEQFLTLKGFEVVGTAHNGEEALQQYKNLSILPDVVIVDYRLPQKDGLIVLREILKVDPRCSVIFLSADPDVMDQALNSGAKLFLEKPLSLSKLANAINLLKT